MSALWTVTAYCHCALCCGMAGQPTASGKMPHPEHTVAAPRNIPMGTLVMIEGIGLRRVQDRMHKRYKGKRLDVFMRTHEAAKKFGVKKLHVTVYEEKKGMK